MDKIGRYFAKHKFHDEEIFRFTVIQHHMTPIREILVITYGPRPEKN